MITAATLAGVGMPDSESSSDCAAVVAESAPLTAVWTLAVPEAVGVVAVSGEVETADVVGGVETAEVDEPDGPALAVVEWRSEYTIATAATMMHASTTVAVDDAAPFTRSTAPSGAGGERGRAGTPPGWCAPTALRVSTS